MRLPAQHLPTFSSSCILAKVAFGFARVSRVFPVSGLPNKSSSLLACPDPSRWLPKSCAWQIAFPYSISPHSIEEGSLAGFSHCLPTLPGLKWAELKVETTPEVPFKGCLLFPHTLSLFLCKNALGCGAACGFGLPVLPLKLYCYLCPTPSAPHREGCISAGLPKNTSHITQLEVPRGEDRVEWVLSHFHQALPKEYLPIPLRYAMGFL